MATSMLLQAAPRSVAELPVSSAHKNEMYTMLQAPSIGDVRRFGAGRKGHGVCGRRRAVLIGFRAQSGLFTLPGIRKAKKDVPEVIEADVSEGTRKVPKLPGALKFGKGKKDNKIVFVAGATGKVGSRVVRELLELGFQVQAGVRDVARGQVLLETLDATTSSNNEPKSWAAKLFKPRTPSRSVELVECNLENEDEIENSLGNAGVVVCAIGASEKEVLGTTGPYRIDYKATENLIKAATNAKVNHFILVTSLGTTKLGWPASALNLFWGVLIWKAKAEKALEKSGLPYTIVRPGGMERPTDAFKETHNLVLAPKDTYSGGQVSSLQVAELIARCVSNLELARYKVLEVVAETTAPWRPIEDLLAEAPAVIEEDDRGTASSELVPSPIRKSAKISRQQEEKSKKLAQAEERREKNLRNKKAAEAEEKRKRDLQEKNRKAAEAEEKRKRDLQEKDRKAAEAAEKKKKELLARYERDLLIAREEEEEARRKVDEALSLKAQLEKRTADLQVQARTAAREAKKAKALENAIAVAARQARRLSEKNKREVLEAASAEFDGERKTVADTEKMPGAEKKTLVASTNSKPEKGLQFKASQAAKLKEAEDRTAKKSAEMDRLAKQQQEANEKEVKERAKKQENEAKAKMEAETKAQAEKDRVTREENEARAKAEAEAKAKVERDRVSQEENEARAKEEAKAKVERDRVSQEENEARAKAEAKAKVERDRVIQEENKAKAQAEAEAQAEKEAIVDKARQAKEEAAARAAIALEKAKTATSVRFLWPWQKESATEKVTSVTSSVNEQIEGVSPQVDPEPEASATPLKDSESEGTAKSEDSSNVIEDVANVVTEVAENSASDEASVESRDSETSPPPSVPVIEDKVSKFAEEVAEDAEAMVEKARQAKEEAATRAAIALEKAKTATSRGFQWPWQKESVNERVSSVTSTVNEQIEGVSPQVDPEPEASATPLEDSESEGTTKSEDSSNVIEDVANVVTEVAENSASDEASVESRDSETSPPPSVPVIEDKVSKFAEEVAEDAEAMVEKARQAKEEAATRAAIALEKAKTAISRGFQWPWQKESATEKVTSVTSSVNEQIEGVSPQVDPEPEASATPLKDSESEGTAKSEDSSNVIEDVANVVTEVAENSASDEASVESRDSETSPPPSVPVIEDKVSKFAEEVAEDAEAMVEKARQAKEEAATRAAIALEKAKTATSRGFQWPWQKESVNERVSSVTSTVNEQIEGVSPQVDPEPEASATPLESSETEGTTEKSEDSSEQASSIINGLATAATEMAENAGEALDGTGVSNVVRDDKEGSQTEPEEKNNSAPLLSKNNLEPDQEE